MKQISYVLVTIFVISALVVGEEFYSDKYDYIDIEEILNNDRLRNQYYKCFMDTGPCITDDAKYFKSNMAEVIVTKCKKCTDKQQENFNKMAEWYNDNKPDEWTAFAEKMINDAKKLNE